VHGIDICIGVVETPPRAQRGHEVDFVDPSARWLSNSLGLQSMDTTELAARAARVRAPGDGMMNARLGTPIDDARLRSRQAEELPLCG
jgi:hypothetical protein